jgi:hypothetical protein|tara:strand:- start:2017 stop:2268 length:252 start_codon:yes stop_codon:yes gene_type:complete
MAIINLHLDLDENYKNFLKDTYKLFVILIVIQLIFSCMNPSKDFLMNALSGDLLNDDIMCLLLIIIIGISAYYLVFNKLLEIN